MSNGKLKVAWDSFGNIKVPCTEEEGEYEVKRWRFRNLRVPMVVRTGDRTSFSAFTTIQVASKASGLSVKSIQHDLQNHPKKYTGLRVQSLDPKLLELLEENRKIFRIERMRQDLYLMSCADLIMIGLRANSTRGDGFRLAAQAFMLENAEMIGIEKGSKAYARLEAEYAEDREEWRRDSQEKDRQHAEEIAEIRQEHARDMASLEQRIDAKWGDTLEYLKPLIDQQASCAGKALQTKKEIDRVMN
jgi:hypothetical protein